MIERAEKQIILARHARRLLNYIDDSPVVPGDTRRAYDHELEARQILEDAENDLRSWEPHVDPIATSETRTHGTNGSNGVDGVNDADHVSLAESTDGGSEALHAEGAQSVKQIKESRLNTEPNQENEPVSS